MILDEADFLLLDQKVTLVAKGKNTPIKMLGLTATALGAANGYEMDLL